MADNVIYALGNYFIIKTQKGLEVHIRNGNESERVARIISSDGFKRAVEWIRRHKAVDDFEKRK